MRILWGPGGLIKTSKKLIFYQQYCALYLASEKTKFTPNFILKYDTLLLCVQYSLQLMGFSFLPLVVLSRPTVVSAFRSFV